MCLMKFSQSIKKYSGDTFSSAGLTREDAILAEKIINNLKQKQDIFNSSPMLLLLLYIFLPHCTGERIINKKRGERKGVAAYYYFDNKRCLDGFFHPSFLHNPTLTH